MIYKIETRDFDYYLYIKEDDIDNICTESTQGLLTIDLKRPLALWFVEDEPHRSDRIHEVTDIKPV